MSNLTPMHNEPSFRQIILHYKNSLRNPLSDLAKQRHFTVRRAFIVTFTPFLTPIIAEAAIYLISPAEVSLHSVLALLPVLALWWIGVILLARVLFRRSWLKDLASLMLYILPIVIVVLVGLRQLASLAHIG